MYCAVYQTNEPVFFLLKWKVKDEKTASSTLLIIWLLVRKLLKGGRWKIKISGLKMMIEEYLNRDQYGWMIRPGWYFLIESSCSLYIIRYKKIYLLAPPSNSSAIFFFKLSFIISSCCNSISTIILAFPSLYLISLLSEFLCSRLILYKREKS